MLELTSRAAATLADNRARNGLSDSIGIRISSANSSDGSPAGYVLRFASHPAPDDIVVDSAGTRVFLATAVAEPLQSSVLDVVDTPEGEQLVLKHRTTGGG